MTDIPLDRAAPAAPHDAPRDIPITAARRIAEEYGYDQVVIYARRHTGSAPREHMTTYGATQEDCRVAARMGETLQRFMGWNTNV